MMARLLLLVVFAAALVWSGVATQAAGPAGEADLQEYIEHWQRLNAALVSFSIGPNLEKPERTEAAAGWAAFEDERNNFADALVWMLRARPPESQFLRHAKLTPMYEEMLAAMTVIVEGMKTGDARLEDRGRLWLIETAREMRETVGDIDRRNE